MSYRWVTNGGNAKPMVRDNILTRSKQRKGLHPSYGLKDDESRMGSKGKTIIPKKELNA